MKCCCSATSMVVVDILLTVASALAATVALDCAASDGTDSLARLQDDVKRVEATLPYKMKQHEAQRCVQLVDAGVCSMIGGTRRSVTRPYN